MIYDKTYDALMMEKNKIKLEYEELSDNYNQVLKVSEQYYAVKKENLEMLAVLEEKNEQIIYLESQMANRSVIIEPYNGKEFNELKNENWQLKNRINELKELIKQLQQDKTDLLQVGNNQSVYDHLVLQNKLKEANAPKTQLSANYTNSQQAENQMMTRVRELQEICDKLKFQLNEKSQECVNAQKDFNDRMHKINSSFHDTNLLNQKLTSKLERFNELDEMCAKYKRLLKDKTKEHATITNESIQLKDHIMRLNLTNDNLKKTIEELWKNLNLRSQQLKEKEQVENKLREKDNEINTLKEKMDAINVTIQKMSAEINSIPVYQAQEKEQVENKLREKDNEINTLKEKMDAINVTIQKMSAEINSIPVYQAQMDAYEDDFRAERAAREKIHQDLCRSNELLDEHILENARLKEEIKHLTSGLLSDVQQYYNNPSTTGRFN
ncbi:optineurin-like [Hydra vulgaris]|uniref:Optineurin-like n=1 Tax=Hydra vulgaris TaxID=6087 RepID=A0ABM4D6A0_HYDVU